MFWFLAIVKKEDVAKGNWIPFYILCQSHGTAETRSQWRVIKRGSSVQNMPKVLVTSIHGNELLVDFMSGYRTRDHMHGSKHKSTKKYYPEGMLCWFPCDHYGQQTGPALIVKRVPDYHGTSDRGLEIYKQYAQTEKLCSFMLSNEPGFEDLYMSRPKLAQLNKYFHFNRRHADAG